MTTPGPPAEWYPDPGDPGDPVYPPPPQPAGYPPPGGYPSPPSGWGYPFGGYPPQPRSGIVQVPGVGPVEVATIWQRALARTIDAAIYLVVGLVALMVAISSAAAATGSDKAAATLLAFLLVAMFTVAFAVLYEWLFVALRGATPGKMALHIKVVDQTTGALVGFGPAFVRHLVVLAPALFPYLGILVSLIVLLSPLFDTSGRLQGWHDRAANDLVIKTDRPPAPGWDTRQTQAW